MAHATQSPTGRRSADLAAGQHDLLTEQGFGSTVQFAFSALTFSTAGGLTHASIGVLNVGIAVAPAIR